MTGPSSRQATHAGEMVPSNNPDGGSVPYWIGIHCRIAGLVATLAALLAAITAVQGKAALTSAAFLVPITLALISSTIFANSFASSRTRSAR